MSFKEVFCPVCESNLNLRENPQKGQHILCVGCKTELAVVSINPVELEPFLGGRLSKEKKKGRGVETFCPECGRTIRLGANIHMGERVVCSSCKTTLELISTNPPELDVAFVAKSKQRHSDKRGSKKGRPKDDWDW